MKTIKEKFLKLLSLKKGPNKPHHHLDANAELTVKLAKIFIEEIQSSYSNWESAYLRVEADEESIECRISCKLPNKIELLDVLQHKSFTRTAIDIGSQLRECIPHNGKKFLVLLLVIENNFNYEIQYEYENSNRWAITKLGGGTGVPVGYSPA